MQFDQIESRCALICGLAEAVPACQTGGMPLSDLELWSAAHMVSRIHGDRAPLFVAERVGALARAGDADGVAAWRMIAHRLAELAWGTAPPGELN